MILTCQFVYKITDFVVFKNQCTNYHKMCKQSNYNSIIYYYCFKTYQIVG